MLKQRGTAFAVISFILLVTFSASAVNNSSFTDNELLSLTPFNEEIQLRVLNDVFRVMNKDMDSTKELPKILISEEVTEDQEDIIAAAKSQGMPFWAFAKGINIYLLDLNIIILGKKMQLHNLAHEYTHYIQVQYEGYTTETFDEFLEYEAVSVQNKFRD